MLDEKSRRVFSSKALNYFDELTKNMSYTKTAQLLGITQPALTQQIKKIERVVGAPLFYSIGKKIYLTDAGTLLLKSTHQMFDLINDVTDQIQQESSERSGTISIGLLSTAESVVIEDFIVEYNRVNPNVVIDLNLLTRKELWDNIQNNKIDLAIMYLPDKSIKSWKIYRSKKIMSDNIMLVHNDEKINKKKSVSYKDATAKPWATYLKSYYFYELISERYRDALVDFPKVIARFSAPYQLLKFAQESSDVYTVLPLSFCIAHQSMFKLYQTPLEPAITSDLSFVYREDKEKIPRIEDFLNEWDNFLDKMSYVDRLKSSR
ncbi:MULTISPECIES: LysR family transcriptional regulator [Companilactobacillus]|uniref:Transcription regulator n=4 Tax=Companilactobacillus TaxID=2767879 RepID=A0ABR5NT03_9LACO|nr:MULTISPECIES: LysR family transcriptional regulator [Companilactobacillus]GEO46120.1 LysR family transcriptional regulator [Companilactobacillus paralimentarius]KAE9560334.1 LysR family transcriptional regulator [Companilactobacillus bobalius]KAE9562074.1 LysR family transcriptional regulator [Companilactobacillus kimchii]KRK51312.1 transcription regulator [Companilactobacillus kimchii DSM 13961 = JCM 10707]KRK83078.1 transcription regulator [Companilactobacillus bobalius DSM 19674]